ncbi:MAG: phthiodiolone/phenolphthiodiolone dimycocerosates ketoreductase [Mycobacterium sp.]|nr:phthiodiolone/phenolphthiodiolone dimycocerosates ketoreductase [Mycobacterium sp.]
MVRHLETAIPFDHHRSTPLAGIKPFVHGLRSADVDYLWLFDEFSGWFPGALWTAANTPAAPLMDPNATYDPFVVGGYAAAHAPTIGLRLTTDAVRAAPAELLRKMMSLANATSGKTAIAIGAGELRQAKPFGHKRSEGLARMEDLFQLMRLLYESDGPISFEGNHWNFENASLGTSRPQTRPEFWALGGGPRLLDIAAQYADGLEAAVPQAIVTPERYAETVEVMRRKVDGFGRDPEAFGFGIWLICIIHEDDAVIDRIVDNPLMKYFAAQFGRFNMDDWTAEGEQSVMPPGYHYAQMWELFGQTSEEIRRITASVPHSMARKAFATGSSAEISSMLGAYRDAGANFVGIIDLAPLVEGPAAAQDSFHRATAVLRNLKGVRALD